MSYKKAEKILPVEILKLVQEYVDGEVIYIPKKNENKKNWGTNTKIRQELEERNMQIYAEYKAGTSMMELTEQFYLSYKSIQRILLNEKKKAI